MTYRGDFALGSTFDLKFDTTVQGVGTTFIGSPVIAAYVDNSVTEITAGITLTVDFDSRTGCHNVRVVATLGNGFAAQTNVQLVVTAGTVGGYSAVGRIVAAFSIENRSDLRPTTAGRTLDVSATGEAGIDWANIGSPTTAVNLSGTNFDVDQVVASVSGAVGSVTGAVGSVTGAVGAVTGAVGSVTGNVGGNVAGTVASVVGAVGSVTGNVGGNVAGSTASVTGAVGSVTAAVTVGTNNDKTGYALSTAGILAIWHQLTAAVVTAATMGKLLVDNIDAAISSRGTSTYAGGAVASVTGNVGGNVTGSVGSVTGAVGSVTGNVGGNVVGTVASVAGAVGSVTGNVGGNVGGNVAGSVGSVTAGVTVTTNNDKTSYALTAAERNAIADALLARHQQGGSAGASGTKVSDALAGGLMSLTIAGGVLTVKNADGSTAYTRTLTRSALDAIVTAA